MKTDAHWTIDPKSVDTETYDLSVHNPNKKEEVPPTVEECEAEFGAIYKELGKLLT